MSATPAPTSWRVPRRSSQIKGQKLLTLAEGKTLLDDFIVSTFNKLPFGRQAQFTGLCPDEVWQADNPVMHRASAKSLAVFCQRSSKTVTVGRNGVKDPDLKVTYWAEEFVRMKGTKVFLRRDIDNYAEAWVYSEDGDLLCLAKLAESVHPLADDEVSKAQLKELAAKAGVSNLHGDKDTLFLRIVDRLDQSGHMIVVDEAENLDAGATDYLRRLNDAEFAGIGILLVGLPRLLQNLRSSQGDYKYIYSRVGWCVPVSNLTDADCKAFVEQALPNDIELWRVFADSSRRNARVRRNLIERSIEIANFNQVAIDASLVRQVRAKLLFN